MQKPERSSYTPIDFAGWHEAGLLEISPQFQRRGVWSRAARSYLIDTLILGYPVPPVYIRVITKPGKKAPVREVVDGQQRISAVMAFIDGEYSLAKNIESPYVGKYFDDLPKDVRDKITQYSFICEVFYGIDDPLVLAIFARLNTHSVKLNAQELRNGKFFGPFKRTAYELALSHLTFWRKNRIFSEQGIARMQEVELTSELIIALLGGMQDKKKSIDDFYKRYDEAFDSRADVEKKFKKVIDEINNSLGDGLSKLEFRRTPLFYSLFLAVAHRLYGVPGEEMPRPDRDHLTAAERERLSDVIHELSDTISEAKADGDVPKHLQQFVTASLTQTDNIRPRQTRMRLIYNQAFPDV